MKKLLLSLSLVLVMILSACASTKTSDFAPAMGDEFNQTFGVEPETPMYESQMAAPESLDREDMTSDPAVQERLVIKKADMRVSVADPETAMKSVATMAERMGGFVVSSESSNTSNSSGGYKSAWITVRVPTEKLNDAMQTIRDLAADGENGVLNESVSGEDVTSDFVDSQSRLRNLQAAEEQLVKLMENTEDLENTMAVFRELTRTREQIEVIQGHLKYLKESASLSAISVTFVAEASLKPIEIGGWKPQGTARDALQTLINIGQGFVDFLIRFSIICLPFLIPLGIGVFFLVKALKKRRAKKQARIANVMQFSQIPPQGPAASEQITQEDPIKPKQG